jgi:LytS/YehU family sensor histidine kinase
MTTVALPFPRAATPQRTQSPLDLSLAVMPHLRGGLTPQSAGWTARLLQQHLRLDAAAVVDTETTLAFVGVGAEHHQPGLPVSTRLTLHALATGQVQHAHRRAEIGCPHPDCPLQSALVLPLQVQGRTVGALKLYRAGAGRRIPDAAARAAAGLARLFGVYLEMADLDAQAARVTRAELEALRAQISPHFLFNTLTTIAGLIRCRPNAAHDLVIQFAEFFRETLAQHDELSTLDADLAYVERYLVFERVRLGHRLAVHYAIHPDARRAVLPVLVVQPLVENAIRHGIEMRAGVSHVAIAAQPKARGFRISVTDDGVGIPAERQLQVLERGYGTGLGMGLNNVNRRLQSLFGPSSGLRIQSGRGTGTQVSFWVPRAASAAPGGV